ncbi:hypothetical protein D3C76_1493280 [compost metagenome]
MTLRRIRVAKNTTPYATQTIAIHTAPVNSISAYSLVVVRPSGKLTSMMAMVACQPQNVKAASLSLYRRTWQVRWTA